MVVNIVIPTLVLNIAYGVHGENGVLPHESPRISWNLGIHTYGSATSQYYVRSL